MAIGDAYRVALLWTLAGGPGMTTFGLVEGSGGVGADPMENVALAVQTALGDNPLEGFNVAYAIEGIQVNDVQPGTRPQFTISGIHLNGTVGEDNNPAPQQALVASWKTALRGPANRGRMFIPGVPGGQQNAGFWETAGFDAASGFVSKLFDPFGPSDGTAYQLNVLSYVPGSHPRALRAAVPITAFSLQNIVRGQRRREVNTRIHRHHA